MSLAPLPLCNEGSFLERARDFLVKARRHREFPHGILSNQTSYQDNPTQPQRTGSGKGKQHKHKLFGPNFLRTFLTLMQDSASRHFTVLLAIAGVWWSSGVQRLSLNDGQVERSSGRHLCRTKLPQKTFKSTRKVKRKVWKTPGNVAEIFEALFSCLKIFHRPFSTVLHLRFQTQFQNTLFHNENLEAWPQP